MDVITNNYPLICSIARKCYSKHRRELSSIGYNFDDYLSFVHETVVLCIDKWNSVKGKLSTYLWIVLDRKTINLIRDSTRKSMQGYIVVSLDRLINNKAYTPYTSSPSIDALEY